VGAIVLVAVTTPPENNDHSAGLSLRDGVVVLGAYRQACTSRNGDVRNATSKIPMMAAAYSTPEEAALAGSNPRFARVVRVRFDRSTPTCLMPLRENEAEIELAMNEPPYEYPYFVHVERVADFWEERQSHN